MKHSEQLNELATALVKAQKAMPTVDKDASGHGYDYASLDNIMGKVRPVLAEHGLAIMQAPTSGSAEEMGLTTRLIHESGQWVEETVYAPRDEGKRRNSVQAAGSTITYLRRYGISALLGLVDEADADGQPPRPRKERSSPRKQNGSKPAPPPTDAMKRKLHAAGGDYYGDDWDTKRAELCRHVTNGRTESSNDLTGPEMAKLIDGIQSKLDARDKEVA